jgi:hypothetical protein
MIDTIFVCGCPRSGNTVIGNLLGTLPKVVYCGELATSYFSIQTSHEAFARIPSRWKNEYRASLINHALDFEDGIRRSIREKNILCDSTPWNARILNKLRATHPNALFLFVIRHFSGVIQSLRISWEKGYGWAGPSDVERAILWRDMNNYILDFDDACTLYVSYDRLCDSPRETISNLLEKLHGFNIEGAFDLTVLGDSFTNDLARPTLMKKSNVEVTLEKISTFDPSDWDNQASLAIRNIVESTHLRLSESHPRIYHVPSNYF